MHNVPHLRIESWMELLNDGISLNASETRMELKDGRLDSSDRHDARCKVEEG